MKIKIRNPKIRLYWNPKRADVFQDKRTKRERTRQRQQQRATKEGLNSYE